LVPFRILFRLVCSSLVGIGAPIVNKLLKALVAQP
jgi:hypothetical protein